jgi:hypothetical protein
MGRHPCTRLRRGQSPLVHRGRQELAKLGWTRRRRSVSRSRRCLLSLSSVGNASPSSDRIEGVAGAASSLLPEPPRTVQCSLPPHAWPVPCDRGKVHDRTSNHDSMSTLAATCPDVRA